MGILLVYDVTDKSSFNSEHPTPLTASRIRPHFLPRLCVTDIRNWIRNIEMHASDSVNRILVGNKADIDESERAVSESCGQALADEFGIKFFEAVRPAIWKC